MKYFRVNNEDWRCNKVFNWIAVDYDGRTTLFQNKPVRNGRRWFTESHSYNKILLVQKRPMYWSQQIFRL